jgi:hypothetical protein
MSLRHRWAGASIVCTSVSEAGHAARRMPGDAGCDVTVDAIGSCEVVEAAVMCLKRMGRLELGFAIKPYEIAS